MPEMRIQIKLKKLLFVAVLGVSAIILSMLAKGLEQKTARGEIPSSPVVPNARASDGVIAVNCGSSSCSCGSGK